jgi:hypothetical protein
MKKKNMLRKFLILAGFLALTISSHAQAPKWLQGNWQGTGDQVDGMKWAVKLDATNLGNIKIEYPDLSCGGNWKTENTKGKTANLVEELTFGQDKCDQGVEMVIKKLSKAKVKVTYFLKTYSPDPIATAILTKV